MTAQFDDGNYAWSTQTQQQAPYQSAQPQQQAPYQSTQPQQQAPYQSTQPQQQAPYQSTQSQHQAPYQSAQPLYQTQYQQPPYQSASRPPPTTHHNHVYPAYTAPTSGNPVDSEPSQPMSPMSVEDSVSEMEKTFDDKNVRRGFIRKVFGILAIQLLMTVGIVCLIYFVPAINDYVSTNAWVYITAVSLSLATMFILICAQNITRRWPANFICLLVFTFFESVMLGTLMTFFDVQEILVAFAIVFVVTVVCFILGFQQRFDFTYAVGALSMVTTCFFMYMFWVLIFGLAWGSTAFALLGAILFSLWLLVDIQMVVGGSHKVSFNPEEYIFAALNIYLDIINILIYVLLIVGGRS